MKRRTLLLAVWCGAALVWPLAAAPRRLLLETGTPVEVRLSQTVSSETSHEGDRVEFVVTSDVRVEGVPVVTRWSLAWGEVVNAVPRGRMARNGKLELEMQGVCLADGSRAPLRAYRSDEAAGPASPSSSGGDNESLLALPALPLMVFLQGKERVLPRGRELTVFIAHPTPLDSDRAADGPQRDCLNTAATGAAVSNPATSAGDLAVVSLRSSPSGADVQIDGAFSGNAPATLRLAPGPHRFTVSVPGYRLYDRVVQLTAGSEISLVVTLEPKSPEPAAAPGPEPKRVADGRRP